MKSDNRPFVEIFTDGACSGNPGAGGYGVILRYEDREKELSGCDPDTTNNRMELTAVIMALEALKQVSCDGQRVYNFTPPLEIEIRKSERPLKLIKTSLTTYFGTLRKKLLWGIDVRVNKMNSEGKQ